MAQHRTEDRIDEEALKAGRRKRSIAMAVALGIIVAIFYALTVVKLGPGLFERGL